MYEAPLPFLLQVGHVTLLFLWMIFPDILGFISSKIVLNFIKYIVTLPKCLKHSFLNLSKFSDLIMLKNIKSMNLPLFYINLVLLLIPLVLAFLSKMAGLSTNFVIFLMLFVLLLLPLLLLLSFGGKLLLLSFKPSIGVLLPLFRIKLLMICCLVLLPPMTYLESLDVSVLFFFKIMKETNFSLVLVYVVFLGMELVKKVIGVMITLANVFVFLGIWSFGNTKCFTNYLMFMFPLFPLSILSLTFFFEEYPISLSDSPPFITDVPSHASNELPALIIDVPTNTAPVVYHAGPSNSHALRRSHRVTTLPSHLCDFHFFYVLASLQEPQTFREASSNSLWQQAMKEELDAPHKTGTWDMVDLSSEKSVIDCKWVYKIKTRSNGTVAPVARVLLRSMGLIMRRLLLLWLDFLMSRLLLSFLQLANGHSL